jgi:hypothetical protein
MAKVEIGVTHQIKIGREDAWIKLSITDEHEKYGDIDDAIDVLTVKVNQRIFDIIEETVESVKAYSEPKAPKKKIKGESHRPMALTTPQKKGNK